MYTAPRTSRWIVLVQLSLLILPPATLAANPAVEFRFVKEPEIAHASSDFESIVRVTGVARLLSYTVTHAVAGHHGGSIHCKPTDPTLTEFSIVIPIPENATGWLTYSVSVDGHQSETRRVPVAFRQELDITGEAAVAYLYPLGSDAYTVRYVPCCNIYGGVTVAERVPVNPVETGEGLPETLLSDFVVLDPDGLSASTMGMYFDFNLGPGAFKGIGAGSPALYEFDGEKWVEFQDYQVDLEAGKVSFHCPTGGEFVLAVKP